MNQHYDHWLECEGDFEVVGCEHEEDYCWIFTNDSLFYIEGGGMAKDTGTINDIEVEDIQMKNGYYAHKVHGCVSGLAHMKVDRKQRIEKAQIHSASHLLSGYMSQQYRVKKITFFTHEEMSGCEMNFSEFNEEMMREIEAACNDYVMQDLPIQIVYPTFEEARKHAPEEKLAHEELRAAVIEGIDYNMCGCIHVPSLRYLQSIKLLGYEKTARGYRIYFVCGEQLLRTYGRQIIMLDACARKLRLPQNQLSGGIEKLHLEIQERKAAEEKWKAKAIALKINELCTEKEIFLAEKFDGMDVKSFQMLCSSLVRDHVKGIFFVCCIEKQCHVVIATHASLNVKANELFKEIADRFDLRGGGNAGIAQGGGMYQDELLNHLKTLAEKMNHII